MITRTPAEIFAEARRLEQERLRRKRLKRARIDTKAARSVRTVSGGLPSLGKKK